MIYNAWWLKPKQDRERDTCSHNDRETYQNNTFAGTCKAFNSSWIQQHKGVTWNNTPTVNSLQKIISH